MSWATGVMVYLVKTAGHVAEKVEIDLHTGGTQTVTLKPIEVTIRRNPPPRPPPPVIKRRKGEPVNPFDKSGGK